jgi:hypothetical protein
MKRIIVSLIIAATALSVGVLSAGGATAPPPNPRISAFGGNGSLTILADTTFYVYHGFRTVDGDSTPQEIMQSQFNLSVDGVKQKGTIVWEYSDTKPRVVTGKFYKYSFPSGLPVGTYLFYFEFLYQGKVVYTNTLTVTAVTSCQYGTVTSGPGTGLYCAPPPA